MFCIILGLGLRLYSINSALPYIVAPDEKRQVLDALSMGARKSLVPLEYTYPVLHKYLLLFCFAIYFFLGLIFKVFINNSDFVFKFLIDPGNVFLIARLLSAVFGVAIIIPVYLIGKHFFSRNTGIIAAIFASFMFQLVTHSQWAVADILLTFFCTWAFYYILRCLTCGRLKDFIFAAFFIGLAVATKYQGIYLVVPYLAMLLIKPGLLFFKKGQVKKVYFSVLVIVIFAIIGNPGIIFNFKENIQRLLELRGEIMGISSLQPFGHNFISVAVWFIKELIRQEEFLGIILAGGILYSICKHSRIDLLFLVYLAFCLLTLVPFGFRFLHLLVYSFAIICVFGARLTERLIEIIFRYRYKLSDSLIVAFIIVSPSLNSAIQLDFKRLQPDTRLLAKTWLEKNIPLNSYIAEDLYDFSVPLQSEYPLLFQDEKLQKYYLEFNPEIRQRYKDYAHSKGAYCLRQVRYETEQPIWPQDMPGLAVSLAEKNPIIKRLYRWFNFYSIEELKQMGVSVVILSSYAYNHFLLDDDKHKSTGLFNPYYKEDTLSSNKQARAYIEGSKYGLIFYLAKRARDFYLPLLELKFSNVKLLQEFYPNDRHLGPVIKIYKLGE